MIVIETKHLPPSVNECFSNVTGKGRVKTERYRSWANAAGYDFKRKGAIKGPFTCSIIIDRDLRHKLSDIDNRIKPTMDLLQTHGIIENDNLCERVTAEWGRANGGVRIEIEAWDALDELLAQNGERMG